MFRRRRAKAWIRAAALCCAAAGLWTTPARAQTVSDSPRAKDFHKELAGNFVNLVSLDNLKPLLIGAAATGAAVIPEQNVEEHFLANPNRYEAFGEPGEIMGNEYLLSPIVTGLFVAGRYSLSPRFRSMSYALAQGLLVNGVVTASLKRASRRERPSGENRLSFPSGHTSTSFMWATVLSRTYGWKAAIPAYLAASYVGATRLEENKHHLTDVVAGATIGYIVGRTVTRRGRRDRERRLSWSVVPARGGFAASLAIRVD